MIAQRKLLGVLPTAISSAAMGMVFTFVSGVLSARALGPGERGELAILVAVPVAISGLLPLGTTHIVATDLASGARSAASALNFAFKSTLIVGLVSVGVTILALSLVGEARGGLAWVAAATGVGLILRSWGTALLQGQQRLLALNVTRPFLTGAYMVAASVLYVIGAGEGWLRAGHFLVAWTGAALLSALLVWACALHRFPLNRGNDHEPSRTFSRGARALIGSQGTTDAFSLDQVLVGAVHGERALGLYVVAKALTEVPRLIAVSIGQSTMILAAADQPRRALHLHSVVSVGLALAFGAVLFVAAPGAIELTFGEAFDEAVIPVRLLALVGPLRAYRRIAADRALGNNSGGVGSIAELAFWLVFTPVIFFLPEGDATMSTAAYCGAQVAAAGALWIIGRRSSR